MRKIFSIILLIIPFLILGQVNNQEAIREIDRAIGKISSMQCDFIQTKHIKMLTPVRDKNLFIKAGSLINILYLYR